MNLAQLYKSKKVLVIIDQAIISGSSFVLSYIAALKLEKFEFGAFMLLITLSNYLFTFHASLVTQPYQINLSKINKSMLIKAGNVLTILIFTIFCIGFFLYIYLKPSYDIFLIINYLLFAGFYIFHEFIRRIEQSNGNYSRLIIFDGIAYGMRIIGVLLVSTFYLNDNFVAWVLFISNLTYMLSIFYFKWKDKKLTHGNGKIKLNSLLEEGKWIIGSTFVFFLSSQLYIFIIATFNSLEDVAIISAVLLPVGLLRPISIGAEGYIVPNVNKIEKKHQWYGFIKESSFFYIPIILISLILILFPKPIIDFFFNDKYTESSIYLCLAAINSLISITIYFISFYLRIIFENNNLFKINVLSLILTFPWGVWLIANNGVEAYFFVLISNNLIILSLSILLVRKNRV